MSADTKQTEKFRRLRMTPGEKTALYCSNQQSMTVLGNGAEKTWDAKGSVIRQGRLALKINPALLATQACISLAQLYDIETGLIRHFHSKRIMEQAARRVAQLLDLEWDCL
jgi:hypothetical protein